MLTAGDKIPLLRLRALALLLVAGLVAGCAPAISGLAITTTTPTGAAERIPATLSKPDGPGPFPAVVILHDCSGLGPQSSGAPRRWTRELVGQGYITLLPDSFTTRGFEGGVCTDGSRSRNDISPARRVRDAYAALAYLRTLPDVDGRRVAVMGGSHGGTTTLATMAAPAGDADPHALERRAGFAAAVALYPACVPSTRSWRVGGSSLVSRTGPEIAYEPVAPLLILIGDKDDWTPAEACRQLAEGARAAGHPVTIKVYPGAHHSFDSPNPVRYVPARINANAPGGRGATTGGDPEAWADSLREVAAFLTRHLR